MSRKAWAVSIAASVVLFAGSYYAYERWFAKDANSRANLLRALPADATAVIYVGVDELRQAALLGKITKFNTGVTTDPEYTQFVRETGFDYERDLNRVGIAVENHGATQSLFALAEGKFDQKKVEAYLKKSGSSEHRGTFEIFHLPPGARGRPISVAFLSNERIALTDGDDLAAAIAAGQRGAGHAEWSERFERLAGTPVFALIRQDAALGAALNAQAPGGLRSPQLAQLLNQLLWISIAGKAEGDQVRAVLEGECPNETIMRQLSDFLNGIIVMAQAGLNDPKLRQQLDPASREAYLQLLKSVEVAKLDRGESKSVRIVFAVTPEIWAKLASATSIAAPQAPAAETAPIPPAKGQPKNKTGGTRSPAKKP